MTAIFYPDCWAASPNGRFAIEARSPQNGTINHRDGTVATDKEFGYKYREHQSEFRYRLLSGPGDASSAQLSDSRNGQVLWERWQDGKEDSPHELVASDDGWSVIRTHGFRPEVIAVSPSGRDVVRVRIVNVAGDVVTEPERKQSISQEAALFSWEAKHLCHSTAGFYWAAHSWPYFIRWNDKPYFVWRTFWGDRIVIDLGNAVLLSDGGGLTPAIQKAMDDEEKRGVLHLLVELSARMREIEGALACRSADVRDEERQPLSEKLRRMTAALHLAGVHRIRDSVPYLLRWGPIDYPSYSTRCIALGRGWDVQVQFFRPILRHSLRVLGEEPESYPAFYFCSDHKERLTVPEPIGLSQERWSQLTSTMSAQQILASLGTPDHIRRRSHPVGRGLHRWTEEWEYDSRIAGKWLTLRITWEEDGRIGRINRVEQVEPYWLDTNQRVMELLSQ